MNNLTASIQDKLRNIAKTSGKDFQLILTRYFQEWLLYRLSQTVHRDNFCLKGGALIRSKLDHSIEFREVMLSIREVLLPIYEKLVL